MSFKFQLSTKVRVISIFSWPMLALPKSQCCRNQIFSCRELVRLTKSSAQDIERVTGI